MRTKKYAFMPINISWNIDADSIYMILENGWVPNNSITYNGITKRLPI